MIRATWPDKHVSQVNSQDSTDNIMTGTGHNTH